MKTISLLLFASVFGFSVSYFCFPRAELREKSADSGTIEPKSSSSEITYRPMASSAAKMENSASGKTEAKAHLASLSMEKQKVLNELTEEDISAWRTAQSQKVSEFLKNNSEFWAVGRDLQNPMNPGRNDLSVLQDAMGIYSGIMKYEIRELNRSDLYNLSLALTSFKEKGENKISMKSNDGGTQSADFTYEYLGTEGREVNIVWWNANGNQSPYASTFAFKLKAGMTVGEKLSTRLMGLDRNLQWHEIGMVEVTKSR